MISFNYENDFELQNEDQIATWISNVILSENKKEGDINYVFCDDEYLLNLNEQYLDHDTLTDIISFDYSVGNELHGDIFISIERVRDNAQDFNVTFDEELKRVNQKLDNLARSASDALNRMRSAECVDENGYIINQRMWDILDTQLTLACEVFDIDRYLPDCKLKDLFLQYMKV